MRMKKLLTFLTLLTVFIGVGWAAESRLTFTAACGGSGTADDGAVWTVTSDAAESTYSSSYGIHYGTNNASVQYLQLSTSDILGTITKVAVTATDAIGVATMTVTVGGTSFTCPNPNVTNTTSSALFNFTGSGSGEIIVRIDRGSAKKKAIYCKAITVTYSNGTTTTYSLTLPNVENGSFSVVDGSNNTISNLSQILSGTNITVTAIPNTGYTLEYMKANGVNVDNPFTFAITGNTEITASFVQEQASTTEWVLTSPSNLTTGDVVLIVDKFSARAMSNNNGTSAAPTATSVTLNSNKDKVTAGVTEALQWEVTNTNSTFNFTVPNGTTHLYCTNNNNGVRVGTGNAKDFVMTDNGSGVEYLTCTGTSNTRYLGVYDNSDWRCYTGMGGNIASTEVAFYKKVETGSHSVTVGTITGEGTITSSSGSANTGDVITVTATPATGYELTALAYNGTAIDITSTPYTFIMPNADVTLTATFSKIDYTITKGSMTNGTVNVAATANYGDVVTITPEPATDYVVDKVYYNDGTDHEIAVNNNAYTFTMPASNVTVWATFVEYYPTLRLAGRFNGRSTSSWITDNSGPEFTYDTSTEKYTIDAYFIGASQDEGSDVDFFYLRSDNDDLKANASGNCWVGANGGTYTLGGSSNFRIYPGVYNITVNKARTSITFTKITPVLTFSPNGGEVEAGQTVTVTSNLQTLVDNIKNTYDSGATGTVNHSVSTDQNNWDDNVTLNTIGSATVYGRAVLGNIYATGNAAYTVVAANTNTQYQLITSTNDLVAGKKYIIVSTGSYTASGTTYNFTKAAGALSGVLLSDVDVTIDENDIIDLASTSGVTEFKLGGTTDAWTFAFSDGTLLTSTTSKQMSATADGTPAIISFDGDEATIDMGTVGNLQYNPNSGNGRFTTYTSVQKPVMLFKQVEGTVTQKSAAPVITPESGNIVGFSQEVEITQANGGTIYYTTDGTTPTEDPTHQYNGKFWAEGENLGDEVTITAVAKEAGKELSNTVTVNYKFVAPAAPVFTPGAGTYTTPQTVTVSSTTEGADVYYTATSGLSAAQIVAQGTKFEEPFTVSTPATYYAVTVYHDAHANRDALSGIRQAQYKFSEVESVDLPYSRPFTDSEGFGDGEFTIQDVENPDDITVWTVSTQYGAKGTSFTSNPNTNHAATSWLLSPYINLGDAEEPVLTFVHQINRHFTNPSTQATVWIKAYGGEWTQLTTKLPENSNSIGSGEWPSFDEEYNLSAYKGQIVQIGFKYDNPTAGSGAGTWEIQNFLVKDNAPIMVENIAEYLALPIGTNNITFKNPVTVQYHYISSTGKSYIYVKDDSGCAYFHQPADGETINQLANGDIIAGGFTGNKVADEMVSDEESNFAMFTDLENFAPNGDKGLADPEHETVARIADATTGVALNNHYITIKKVKLSALYKPEDVTYGNPLYFDIDNEAHIGYNKFNIDWSVVDDLDAYYNITGIQTAYNNVMEFHPTEIVKWEESVVTLRQLCDEGVTTAGDNEYTISNNLMCVFAKDNSIWVKDDTGQSIWMTSPAESDANFEVYAEAAEGIDANTRLNQAYYDQSNWCEIKLANGVDASQFEGKIIKGGTIHGNFTNKLNPTLENVTLTSAAISSEGDYAPNYYMPANFFGPQKCYNPNHSTDYGQNYFYMTPKPQEYAQIVWAVWSSQAQKFIMSTSDNDNGHRFEGEFSINLSMNTGAKTTSSITDGYGYNFTAIIKKTESKDAGYMVYPLDLDEGIDPATAIESIVTGKAVKSVKFYNVAGIESATPFQGINIVVTEYTDGTRTTTKMLCR